MTAYFYLILSLILINLKFSNDNKYKSKKIIIAPIRVSPSHYLEFFYGCYLAKKGADISALIDIDNVIKKCNYSKRNSFTEKKIKNILIRIVCFISNIKIIPITKESKILINNGYKSNHVKSEVNRLFYTKTSFNENLKDLSDSVELDHRRIYRTLEGIKINKNTSFFFSHGIYYWGLIYDFCKNKNINFRIYYPAPYIKNKLYLSKENVVTGFPDNIKNNSTDNFYKKSNKEAKEIIESRLKYLSYDQKSFKKNKASSSYLKEKLEKKVKKYKNIISFFPNVLFDNNLPERNSIFNGIIECINETIDNLKEENLLIIRAHPAEAALWSGYTKLKTYIN